MKKFKNVFIDIVMENCGVVRLNGNHNTESGDIVHFYMGNIQTSIVGHEQDSMTFEECKSCDRLYIVIKKEFNQDCKNFDVLVGMPGEMLFDAIIDHQNITCIDIIYEDEDGNQDNQYISVPWDEKDDFTNFRQKAFVDEKGNLVIEIK